MNKSELRKLVINKRDTLRDRNEKDEIINIKLMNSHQFKNSNSLFIYVNFGSEVSTMKIIEESLSKGKSVYVPRVDKSIKEMEAVKIDSIKDLVEGAYGILEPLEGEILENAEDLDLIIMPGVVFDRSGGRIGYGGGFYDKFLSKLRKSIYKIALAYEVQIIENLPKENHDIPYDQLITDM